MEGERRKVKAKASTARQRASIQKKNNANFRSTGFVFQPFRMLMATYACVYECTRECADVLTDKQEIPHVTEVLWCSDAMVLSC